MAGSVSGNSRSTTGPTTWTTLPLLIFTTLFPSLMSIVAELTAGDLQKLLGDVVLARPVILERQMLDESRGIICGVRHGHHPRALFTGLGFQQNPVHNNV